MTFYASSEDPGVCGRVREMCVCVYVCAPAHSHYPGHGGFFGPNLGS